MVVDDAAAYTDRRKGEPRIMTERGRQGCGRNDIKGRRDVDVWDVVVGEQETITNFWLDWKKWWGTFSPSLSSFFILLLVYLLYVVKEIKN